MSGYQVKFTTVAVGEHEYRIRSLLDRQQFWDPDGAAAARGIPEASWSYFGQLWSSGVLLAQHVAELPLAGQRILEIGCGLALAGMEAHRRGADVTVSDIHPLCEPFLQENLALNELPPLRYRELDWSRGHDSLGRFDLIIGSDVLYEASQPRELADFMDRHTEHPGRVIICDPGRPNRGRFDRLMSERGFSCTENRSLGNRHRLLCYERSSPPG